MDVICSAKSVHKVKICEVKSGSANARVLTMYWPESVYRPFVHEAKEWSFKGKTGTNYCVLK
jgi:hypothetical protein